MATRVPGDVPLDGSPAADDAARAVAGGHGNGRGSRREEQHMTLTDLIQRLTSDARATLLEKTTASCELYRRSRTRTACQRIKHDGGYRVLTQCVRAAETALLAKLFAVGCLLHMHDHLGLASDLDEMRSLLPELTALLPPLPLGNALHHEGRDDEAVADELTRISCLVEVVPASRTVLLRDSESEWLARLVTLLDTGSPGLVTESLVLVAVLAQGDTGTQDAMAAHGVIPHLVYLLAIGSDAHATHAAAAIAAIAEDNPISSAAFVAAGVIPSLAALVRAGTHEAKAHAAHALAAVASDPDTVAAIEKAGAILPLVELLTQSEPALALAATLALAALAANDYTRVAIARADGAIAALVQLVSVGSNPQRTAAARMLAQLTRLVDNRTAVVSAGAIVPLVHAVATGTDAQQQHHALLALTQLADLPASRVEMARAGVIQMLVHHVRSNALWTASALALLTALAQDDASSVAILDAGLVEWLVASLSSGDTDRDDNGPTIDRLLAVGCLEALRGLSVCDANVAKLAALGALERLVYVAGHGDSDVHQAIALDVVVRLAGVVDHHAALAQAGVFEMIADRLRHESNEAAATATEPTTTTTTVTTTLLTALCRLSADQQYSSQLERAGAIELCVGFLTRTGSEYDDETTRSAVRTLTHLAVRSDLAVRIVQAGAIEPLKTLLLTPAIPTDTDGLLLLAAAESLLALAAVDANRTEIKDAHVVDAVVARIQRSTGDLKTSMLDVLIQRVADPNDPVLVHALLTCRPVERLVERINEGSRSIQEGSSSSSQTKQLFVAQRALGYLVAAATDNVLIMAAPTIEPLVQLLSVSHDDVGKGAAILLQLFATQHGFHAAMLHAGAVERLLTMLTRGSTVESKCAASTLSMLAAEPSTTLEIVRCGAVARLITTLRDNATPIHTTAALRVLNCLPTVHQAAQCVADANAMPLLLDLLRSGSRGSIDADNTQQRKYVAEILVGLSNFPTGRSALLATPGTLDLVMLVFRTSVHVELRESCAVLLAMLATTTSGVRGSVLVSTGVLHFLVTNVDADDDTVRERAMVMVSRMLAVRTLRPLVCDAGGHTALQKRGKVGSKDDATRAAIGLKHVSLLDTLCANARAWWRQRGKRQVYVKAAAVDAATTKTP